MGPSRIRGHIELFGDLVRCRTANEKRQDLVLAQDLASLDVLSDGRLDVAIGAGDGVDHGEVPRRVEPRHELAAERAAIAVRHDDGNVAGRLLRAQSLEHLAADLGGRPALSPVHQWEFVRARTSRVGEASLV